MIALIAMAVNACSADGADDEQLRRVLEAESVLAAIPPGGRSRGPLQVAEPMDFGDVTGRQTPMRVIHEIEVPDGRLPDIVDFFVSTAVTDGFPQPSVACVDLPDELSVADVISMAERAGETVGLHVSVRAPAGETLTARVEVYDATGHVVDPLAERSGSCDGPPRVS